MTQKNLSPYKLKNKVRVLTATSLFDGHGASINIMRRILQSSGAEVIHLGHNRSVKEILTAAIQEDVHAIALTSYQGGHVEFFKYLYDELKRNNRANIGIFGGGGGTILPEEIQELESYGICKIYSPDDGRRLGLQGMINEVLEKSDYEKNFIEFSQKEIEYPYGIVARMITYHELDKPIPKEYYGLTQENLDTVVIGITGTGGAGKSSLTDELVRRFQLQYPQLKIGIISIDPTKKKTGGALLGDRIRMNFIYSPNVFMRSLATREENQSISKSLPKVIDTLKKTGFELIFVETTGIGQSDTQITNFCDLAVYVMTPEYGAATQLEKIDMIDYADFIVINKFEQRGGEDALRDVKRQYQRSRQLFSENWENMPVFGTNASLFNDEGVNKFFLNLIQTLSKRSNNFNKKENNLFNNKKIQIIPPERTRYLAEIVEEEMKQRKWLESEIQKVSQLYQIKGVMNLVEQDTEVFHKLVELYSELETNVDKESLNAIQKYEEYLNTYKNETQSYYVREKEIIVKNYFTSLSGTKIPKIALPKKQEWGEILEWTFKENFPGKYPYTAGVYPFKRTEEEPIRMFAGEGDPERTNKRFHYLSAGQKAIRLSTAFDSVTLYGENPDTRPDIYGKIGNSGVSIASLDDVKRLYSGFDLCDPKTSVSMTINGPAPMILAFFLNAAIDQQCEKYIVKNNLTDEINEKILKIYAEKWGETQISKLKDYEYYRGVDCSVSLFYGKKKFTIFLLVQIANRPEIYGATTCKDEEYVEWKQDWLIPKFLYEILPKYHGDLPEGNNGLGLLLLGVTGDQVLPKEVYEKIKAEALMRVRGTVQADILKEDQAQNTCIFSTEFALKMMGDIQEYFIQNNVKNFYSVSISGYHMAEAGANPITQLAFTLANGFTYVEYYLARGMKIDEFCPNFSFFFSNGLDPEYSVLGRVARRIWAKAIKNKYNGNSRSQMLKYHIQTSGRSLHAQEIQFNDIRTTLQALYAIYDNCNSLHTNAYDEAITTPTEESVRRAVAIQLIINRELGLAKTENPLQGSFIIEELTDLVEEAVYAEFKRISQRGGVLGAMETMYQRNKIQDESLYYEHLKHTGEYPIIGVNTFLDSKGSPTIIPQNVVRSTKEEKDLQIQEVQNKKELYKSISKSQKTKLIETAMQGENIFETLMEVCKFLTLGEMTECLYQAGGQYRRNT